MKSVSFKDSSDYLVGIDVFHQLHCLVRPPHLSIMKLRMQDRVRKGLYPDIYPRDELYDEHISKTGLLLYAMLMFLEHCLDSIRMSLQCNADVSIVTFKWIANYSLPWPDFRTTHQCRNWDTLLDWVKERQVDMTGEGKFFHPQLGLVTEENMQVLNPLRNGGVRYVDEQR
jgi:hypothetical protein